MYALWIYLGDAHGDYPSMVHSLWLEHQNAKFHYLPTYSIEQSPWEGNRRSDPPTLIELERSLQCSQEPATGPYPE
jgi:hypothetical protein